MITLKKVTINKYKSIETVQSFDVEPDVTVLVGKNESGKTAILEAITKSNPYLDHRFITKFDYPRKDLKRFERRKEDIRVIQCTYEISQELMQQIQEDVGPKTLLSSEIVDFRKYQSKGQFYERPDVDTLEFFNHKFEEHDIRDNRFKNGVREANLVSDLPQSGSEKSSFFLSNDIAEYLQYNAHIKVSLSKYVYTEWIQPHLPKFLYYDEYYALPSEVDITLIRDQQVSSTELKTSRPYLTMPK